MLEKAQDFVVLAIIEEKVRNGKSGETYKKLFKLQVELEDVYELEELSAESKETLKSIGFKGGF